MERRLASPVVLLILDGWGLAHRWGGNAISRAHTPFMEQLLQEGMHTELEAAGRAVGLPGMERGNSETGHLNLGAGRVVRQDYSLIAKKIEDESFFEAPAFLEAIRHLQGHEGTLHLLGMVSDAAVHSHIDHLLALIEFAAQKKIKRVIIHAITDGRDVGPMSAEHYLKKIEKAINDKPSFFLATLCGRYWALDRDNRWDRTERAYRALVREDAAVREDWRDALSAYYADGITDEFIPPTIIKRATAQTNTRIRRGDSVIFFNFRADRARQLTRAFVSDEFSHFRRGDKIEDVCMVTFVNYEERLPGVLVAFEPEKVVLPLTEILSLRGIPQFHIAETEKYAHVTYFFNGGREHPYAGEERVLIPSARIATYDSKPEMSSQEIVSGIAGALEKRQFHFLVANFANPDMVGHTGNMNAAIRACEIVDSCVGEIWQKSRSTSATLMVTADHGNVEEMINPTTGEADTEHSRNPVPFLLSPPPRNMKPKAMRTGKLADVAPTILELLHIPQPREMTGTSLLK